MAKGLNKVFIIGNLGRDPDVRHTSSGTCVAKFSVATAESEKRDGQWQDHTEWHRVVCFGRTAEVVGQYMKKGSRVHVEGVLRTSSWEKDGEKKYSTEILVRELIMMDAKGDSSAGNRSGNAPPPTTGRPAPKPQDGFDDDIPF